MPENGNNRFDPLGLFAELQEATDDPRLDSTNEDHVRAAAGELAIALGRCRLFGVNLGNRDGTLAAGLVKFATDDLIERAHEQRDEFQSILKRRKVHNVVSLKDHLFEALESRMDLWAGYIAIEEGHEAVFDDDIPAAIALEPLVDKLVHAIQDYDGVLMKVDKLFAAITHAELLNNWRNTLAPAYREQWPWWLDGRLEEIAGLPNPTME